MSRTYTITLEFEVKMTYSGAPASGPSFSGPGEPAEPPEFEIETCGLEGPHESFEKQYKAYKDKMPKEVPVESFDNFVINRIYDHVLEKAHEDNWDDEINDLDAEMYDY